MPRQVTESEYKGRTDTGPAIEWTASRLKNQANRDKILIVVTDGEPYYSGHYNNHDYGVQQIISRAKSRDAITVIGVGIGSEGVEAVKENFPIHVVVPDTETLVPEIATLLEKIVLNPASFR